MTWERLAHVALSTAGDTLDSGTFTAKKNMQVIIHIKDTGTANAKLQVNSFTGAGYSYRYSESGSSDTTAINQNDIRLYETGSGTDVQRHIVLDIQNMVNKVKTIMGEVTEATATGAGTAPTRVEVAGSFEENPLITSIQIKNDASGSFAAGSYITVLGAKEEATADTLSVTGMEAKKHLMIQIKNITTGGAVSQRLTFNNDTGNNYASRQSFDGGSDATSTSGANINAGHNDDLVTDSVGFTTTYVINEASKEKLAVTHSVSGEAAGAGTAPTRDECVFKWTNTSNQITRVDITNNKAGSYAEGTEITVYGTD